MKLHQLKELVKQVVREEQDYQQLFKHMLDKTGKSIPSMSDDDKKKFFNAVDTAYKAKSEGRLTGYNESVNESIDINHWKKYANGGGPLFSRKVKTQSEFNTEFREVAYGYNNDPDSRENRLKRDKIEKVKKLAQEFFDKEGFITSNIIDEMWSAMVSGKIKEGKVNEAELTAGQKKIDTDGDGEIEGSDLAKLRANKDESVNESLPKWNTEREATKMAVGKGRYDDKVIVNRTTQQADIYNDYMNNVAKDDNDRTWASKLIWHSESQGEFNNNFEKLGKLVAKHK